MGAVFLIAGALHGAIWYDESYSVALARQGFGRIWQLTALDVHPPLYYWMLHAAYLVTGQSITAYRLLSVAGTLVTAFAGGALVRRRFGARAGFVFAALILFLPFSQHMAWQIRMYSWALCAVTFCFLAALRIMDAVYAGVAVLRGYWAVLAVSGLAAAYLHYYAAIAAFLVNVALLVVLLRRDRRLLVRWGVCAAAQVLLYVPWIAMLASQVATVSDSYWITFEFPRSLLAMLYCPFITDMLPIDDGCAAVGCAAAALFAIAAFAARRRAVAQGGTSRALPSERMAMGAGVFVFLGLIAMVVLASVVMGRPIAFYRYMVVAFGPASIAAAIGIARASRWLGAVRPGRAVCRIAGVAGAACGIAYLVVCFAVIGALYAPQTRTSVELVTEAALDDSGAPTATVMGASVRAEGVLAALYPQMDIVYLSCLPESWWTPGALAAYKPEVREAASWDEALSPLDAGDRVVYVSEAEGDDALDAEAAMLFAHGLRIERRSTVVRPLDRVPWTVSICTVEKP